MLAVGFCLVDYLQGFPTARPAIARLFSLSLSGVRGRPPAYSRDGNRTRVVVDMSHDGETNTLPACQWGRRESNPDALRHEVLNLACLPVPSRPHCKPCFHYTTSPQVLYTTCIVPEYASSRTVTSRDSNPDLSASRATENRTPVTRVKTSRPGPLDDRPIVRVEGFEPPSRRA